MAKDIEVLLTSTDPKNDRHLSIGMGMHGDLNLSFRSRDDEVKRYYLSHGNDVPLFGSMIGYWVRLGIDEPTIRETFARSTESILSEEREERFFSQLSISAILAAQGKSFQSFDRPDLGWNCLMRPAPMVPDSDLEGGTATYMTTGDPHARLVIAKTLGPDASPDDERAAATYLDRHDAPLIARAIAQNALGDYREAIAKLMTKRFPELN